MLCLRFSMGGGFYGLEVDRVVEVVPWVPLRKIEGAPDYIPGCFSYRGMLVPVVDVVAVSSGKASKNALSSRIAVVIYRGGRLLGLLMEKATDTVKIENLEAVQDPGIETGLPHLGNIAVENGRMVQFVDVDSLLPDHVREIIFPDKGGGAP